MPEHGFNVVPAVLELASAEQRAQFSAELACLMREARARGEQEAERFWAQYTPAERAAIEQEILAQIKRDPPSAKRNVKSRNGPAG